VSILQKDPLSEFFLKKEPGYRLGDFFSNSKRLGGYTQ
jgi:hypothetical protein